MENQELLQELQKITEKLDTILTLLYKTRADKQEIKAYPYDKPFNRGPKRSFGEEKHFGDGPRKRFGGFGGRSGGPGRRGGDRGRDRGGFGGRKSRDEGKKEFFKKRSF